MVNKCMIHPYRIHFNDSMIKPRQGLNVGSPVWSETEYGAGNIVGFGLIFDGIPENYAKTE